MYIINMRCLFFLSVLLLSIYSFAGPVSQYGRLFASGNKIVAEKSGGQAVQLKGPSMQWSVTGWGSDKFFRTETADALIDGWAAQIIRVPLGLSVSGSSGNFDTGYDNPAHKENVWNRVKTVADAAIAKDVYVIIDWHSHSAHNVAETELAKDFFTNLEFAGKYGNDSHVIFEIYNEPEDNVAWAEVKTYANAVIKAIRDAGFNNLILVGNPYWDTQPNIAANDPPTDPSNNFVLTFHFYAAAHKKTNSVYGQSGKTYRDVVQETLNKNIPVFVSEWGTNDASESGKPNFAETDKWHSYLDSNKISSCAWGVTASGIYGDNELDYWSRWGNPLHYDASDLENWTDPYRMTPHGRYIYKWLTGKDTTAAPGTSWPGYAGASSSLSPASASAWHTLKDDGGVSTISDVEIVDGAAHFTYTLGKGTYEWDPYVGASFGVNGLESCKYGISYQYKGSAHTLRAEQSNVKDWDFHINYKSTPKVTDWVQVIIPWGFFWQAEWGDAAGRDSSLVENLTWHIQAASGSGELWVKDVLCLENAQKIVPIRSRQPVLQVPKTAMLKHSLNGFVTGNGEEISVFDLKGNFMGRGIKVQVPSGIYVVSPNIP
jgi:endoglucanase